MLNPTKKFRGAFSVAESPNIPYILLKAFHMIIVWIIVLITRKIVFGHGSNFFNRCMPVQKFYVHVPEDWCSCRFLPKIYEHDAWTLQLSPKTHKYNVFYYFGEYFLSKTCSFWFENSFFCHKSSISSCSFIHVHVPTVHGVMFCTGMNRCLNRKLSINYPKIFLLYFSDKVLKISIVF